MKKNRTLKLIYITLFVLLLLIGSLFLAFRQLYKFIDTHTITFNQVVKVQFKEPITINKRAILKPVTIIKVLDYPDEIDTPIEKYICHVFGIYNCKTALAIAKAESGLREDAININTNNTIDVGIFQINTVHFKKYGCSLKDLVDAYKNTDCAYSIYKANGNFGAWVGFTNGSFKNHLE